MIICTVFALHYYHHHLAGLSQHLHHNYLNGVIKTIAKSCFASTVDWLKPTPLSLSKIKSNGTEIQKPETKDELELDSTMSRSKIEF